VQGASSLLQREFEGAQSSLKEKQIMLNLPFFQKIHKVKSVGSVVDLVLLYSISPEAMFSLRQGTEAQK